MATDSARPQPNVVADFHTNDDIDSSKEAHHHSIGTNESQAAAGSHVHNGSDSYQLLTQAEVTGSRGGNTALASVIAILTSMGAKDSSTA